MARDELIKRLEALRIEAMKERDTRAAAGVLSALIGALVEGTDDALLHAAAEHSRAGILRHIARNN